VGSTPVTAAHRYRAVPIAVVALFVTRAPKPLLLLLLRTQHTAATQACSAARCCTASSATEQHTVTAAHSYRSLCCSSSIPELGLAAEVPVASVHAPDQQRCIRLASYSSLHLVLVVAVATTSASAPALSS
jgi:hypothetical protein